jgi:ribA/ribD-fused uncharacterized protein
MCDLIIGNIQWLRNDYYKDLEIGGIIYPTLEHAYQAAKAKDRNVKNKIRCAPTIREARKIGKETIQIDMFDREEVMTMLLRKKFADKELGKLLADTGNQPIVMEGHDDFWGTGKDSFGQNVLGIILESIRGEIQFLLGINPEEDDSCKESDEDDEAPSLKEALLNLPDAELVEACQVLFDCAKGIISIVDSNDYNEKYLVAKTGISISDAKNAVEKVVLFRSALTELDNLITSTDEDDDDDDDDDCDDEYDSEEID